MPHTPSVTVSAWRWSARTARERRRYCDSCLGRRPRTKERRGAPGARIGYLSHEAVPGDEQRAVFETYRDGPTGPESTLVATLFGNGPFRLEDVSQRVGLLSAGQRRKLDIARLVALRPSTLVLDEATNFSGLDVLVALEAPYSPSLGLFSS